MEHYSHRLGRNFQDDDWLDTREVKQILSKNSGGRPIISRNLTDLARTHNLTRERPTLRDVLYRYGEIKNLSVAAKRGRPPSPNPSPGAIRQKRFKDKQRRDRAQEEDHIYAL